uniref:Uncharacterized protein n=1 Tax=Lepeophtheirus salmonis TaxID=72036 RepID=A0A0K2UHL9_LEPSM
MIGYPKRTVYNFYNHWKEEGVYKRKANRSWNDKKINHSHIPCRPETDFKGIFWTPINVFAKKGKVSRAIVSSPINTDLRMKSYRLYKRHILTD